MKFTTCTYVSLVFLNSLTLEIGYTVYTVLRSQTAIFSFTLGQEKNSRPNVKEKIAVWLCKTTFKQLQTFDSLPLHTAVAAGYVTVFCVHSDRW